MRLNRFRHKFLFYGCLVLICLGSVAFFTGTIGKKRKAIFEDVSLKTLETLKITDQINDLNDNLIFYLFQFRLNGDSQLILDALRLYQENKKTLLSLRGLGDDPRDQELIEDIRADYTTVGAIFADIADAAQKENTIKSESLFDQIVLAQANLRASLIDLRVRRTVYLQKRFDVFKTMYEWTNDLSVGLALLGILVVLLLIAFYEFVFLRPLASVSNTLRNMNEANLNFEIPKLYKDELGELQSSLRRAWSEVRHRLEVETRLNQELRSLNQGLKHFSQIASHDLKEPLAALLLYADLAEAELGPQTNPQIKKHIDEMRGICKRMRSMIDGLLALFNASRKDLQMEDINLNIPLEEAIRNLKPKIEERGVIISKPEEMPIAKGNSAQLVELFQNLIGNGIKYNMSDMPRVSISVVPALSPGDVHIVSVRDNGIGIRKVNDEDIFDFFVRGGAKTEFKGLGIGLALCKKIVEQHGGEIWIDSNSADGSTFSFSLPS